MRLTWWAVGIATFMFAISAMPTRDRWATTLMVRFVVALTLCGIAYALGALARSLWSG
jgi:hypothetical protein